MLEDTVEITIYETLHNAEIFSNCSDKMAPHLPKQPQQWEGGQHTQQIGTWCHFLIDLTPPNSLLDVPETFFLVLCPGGK